MWLVGGASKDPRNEVLISMASVDKYSPTNAQWTRKTLISNPRHSAAVVAVGKSELNFLCAVYLSNIKNQAQ